MPMVTSLKPLEETEGPQEMEGWGTLSCSPVSCRGQKVEEGVIEGSSLDPPLEGQKEAGGHGIHASRELDRICCRLWLLWMNPYSSYT